MNYIIGFCQFFNLVLLFDPRRRFLLPDKRYLQQGKERQTVERRMGNEKST